jgi:hypothetical protein
MHHSEARPTPFGDGRQGRGTRVIDHDQLIIAAAKKPGGILT